MRIKSYFSSGKQVKMGVIFSYVLIIANALLGFVVTPYILYKLGNSHYGVYKTISSLTSSMMVLDFGLGGTIMRYVSKYRTDEEYEKIPGFLSMAIYEAAILIFVVGVVSVTFYLNIGNIYGASFTDAEIVLANRLFIILAVGVAAHITENIFNGVITGFNNFIFGNGIKIIRLVIRICLIFFLLSRLQSALVLVSIDLAITIVSIIVEIVYIRIIYKINIRISLKSWDMAVFKESFAYTFLIFLTSIAAQINSNLDISVIGAIKGTEMVTVYSFGIVIFSMYTQLSTSVSGVMLPTVTQTLKYDSNGKQIQDLIVRAGRIQFSLLGAAVIGFYVLGRNFIQLWLGDGFEDVYIIVLILMIPSLFELCVNVCLAVLRAKNMLGFRTFVLISTSILNLIITVVGVTLWSYFAAAIGTAISFIVGSLIIMNIYYYKKLHYPMLKIYRRIVSRIWVCLLVAGIAIKVSSQFIIGGWLAFIGNVIIFCVIYGACLLLWGLTRNEKRQIPFVSKFIKLKENKRND